MTSIRKVYIARFIARCVILPACALMLLLRPEEFEILHGWNFFRRFSVFHLLWGLWVIDMLAQLMPIPKKVALGSQKLFRQRFQPIRDKINYPALRQYVVSTTKAAYQVFLMWVVLLAAIGFLYYRHFLNDALLFMISVTFYVFDLICVLIWCPFRLILKSRCCTTCRIFNWDHLMMFTPMLFIQGFYSLSLLALALAVWAIWELCVLLYPERFWEHSNKALRCSECTDKLCTQYCQKLRR